MDFDPVTMRIHANNRLIVQYTITLVSFLFIEDSDVIRNPCFYLGKASGFMGYESLPSVDDDLTDPEYPVKNHQLTVYLYKVYR